MSDARTRWAEGLRLFAAGVHETGSPFYGRLLVRMADDVAGGGPSWPLLEPFTEEPPGNAYQLRLLAAVHRMVLSGDAPALARHFPSTGGDGDADAAWPDVRELLAARPQVIVDAFQRPPQTNEVGRSAALVGGFLVLARELALPLRLRELGTSAGLNLRFDRYWFAASERDARGYGDPRSPVRFEGVWTGGTPPFDAPLVVADRRGCDADPIDANADEGRLTLLSCVWPDQAARFTLLRAALEVARGAPVAIDRADIVEWLPGQLAAPGAGVTTVVFHSIVWQYLDVAARTSVEQALAQAGAAATSTAPLAWLRLEPATDFAGPELRLTVWPGGDERLLATAEYHLGRVGWLV